MLRIIISDRHYWFGIVFSTLHATPDMSFVIYLGLGPALWSTSLCIPVGSFLRCLQLTWLHCLDCVRKPEHPEKIHTDLERTYKLHAERIHTNLPGDWTQDLLVLRQQLSLSLRDTFLLNYTHNVITLYIQFLLFINYIIFTHLVL